MKFILSILVLIRSVVWRIAEVCVAAGNSLHDTAVRIAGRLVSNAYAKIAEAQELAGIIRREADLYAQHIVRKAGTEHKAAADLLDKIKRG